MTQQHRFVGLTTAIVLLLLPLRSRADISGDAYTLGVFPYLPPSRLEVVYAPVAAAFAELLQRPVVLRSRRTFKLFREEVQHGRYDIIFIQPFDYVRVAAPNGYRALARPIGELRAVFVTREDSSIRSLEQLRGKVLVMPPKDAAASLLGRLSLDQSGLAHDQIKLQFVQSHFDCMRRVVLRRAAACVTAPAPIRLFESRTHIRLARFAESQAIPSTPVAVHSRVPKSAQDKLRASIVGWAFDGEGRKLLDGLKFQAYVSADDDTYDPVREIWRRLSGPQSGVRSKESTEKDY